MKESLQIEWFNVTDCLPVPGKEVMVTDGNSVSVSNLKSIVVHPDGKGWTPHWWSGEQVVKWAFMPELPEMAKAAGPDKGPSVW